MQAVYRILADVVVVLHVSYVAFVILGQFTILVGWFRGWRWVQNIAFRAGHLAAIVIVVLEAWFGITCPLTTWENSLREKAGQMTYEGDFIAEWMHQILFFTCPPWVFTVCYSAFGALVVLTLWLVPPRIRPRGQTATRDGFSNRPH
jgi:hypothetical protein